MGLLDSIGRGGAILGLSRRGSSSELADLRESDRRFRGVFEHLLVGMALIDHDGKFTFVNRAFSELLGYSRSELLARDLLGATHREDRPQAAGWLAKLKSGEERSCQFTIRYMHRSTNAIWVRLSLSPASDAARPVGFVAVIEDVSEQKFAQWLELDRREILEMVAQDQPLPGVFNAITRLIERQIAGVNACLLLLQEGALHTFAPSLPQPLLEAIGRRPLSLASGLVNGQMPPDLPPKLARIQTDPAWKYVREEIPRPEAKVSWSVPLRANDGSPVGLLVILSPQDRAATAAEQAIMAAALHLATVAVEHHHTTRQLAHLVRHDPLTGVPNRVFYEDRLDQALSQARRKKNALGLIALDLNRFKHINDTFGHQAGDALLQQFAQRLRGVLRECDTIARVGGDEFAIILPDIGTRQNAQGIIAKLAGALAADTFPIAGQAVSASSSMGLAMFPEDGADTVTLQHKADIDMYKSKERSRPSPQPTEKAA